MGRPMGPEAQVAEGAGPAGSSAQEAWSRAATLAVGGPLAWINFNLNLVRTDGEEGLTPGSRKALRAAHAASRRLADMLDSLLITQRIHAGLEAVATGTVALTTALEPEVRALVSRAQEEEKTFSWTSTTIGLATAADERLLRRSFRLVCGRALDEAPKGGKVRASALPGAGDVRVRVSATLDPEDPCALAEAEPAEFAFARLATESMGALLETMRSIESGLVVDFVLPKPGRSLVAAPRAVADLPPAPRSPAAPALGEVHGGAAPMERPPDDGTVSTGFKIVRDISYQFVADE